MDLQSLPWYGQLLVFLLIGGVLFGFFYALYYSEAQGHIETLDKQISSLETENKKAEKKKDQLPQIKAELAAKEAVLRQLKEILPEGNEISQSLRKVQSIISGARLKMLSWDTLQERRGEIYAEIPFAIGVEGNYHNLGIFFDQLSKLRKIFTVSNLRIRPLKPMSSLFSISASFTASTYIYKEEAPKSAPAKAKKKPRKAAESKGGGDEVE